MFHRVDDPQSLDAARYFQLAELLPAYDGAIRLAARREAASGDVEPDYSDLAGGAPMTGAPPAGPAMHHDPGIASGPTDDIASLARMSQQPGFPGIEYQGG